MTTSGSGRKKVKLNLYLEPKVALALSEFAEKHDISRSRVVERAVAALMMVERENELQRARRRKNGHNHAGV